MNNNIKNLYNQWKIEFNKGHNKDFLEDWPEDPSFLFGNQDFIIDLYQQVFDHYNIKLEGRLLDIGCSMGGLLFSLAKSNKFNYIAGFDIDKSAILMAQEYKKLKGYNNVDIKIGSALEIPFPNNSFDIVLFKDIAEHLENNMHLKKALLEANRVLKKGGFIFIEAPNYYYPYEPHLKMIKPLYYSSKKILKILAKIFKKNIRFIEQLNFTTPRMLKKDLDDTGFNFIKDVYYDYRLKWKFNNIDHSLTGNKFNDKIIANLKRLKIDKLACFALRVSRLYPILWFIARKK